MSAHRLPFDMHMAPKDLPDPGSGGSIIVDRHPCVVTLVSAGAEARTLARPTRSGDVVWLYVKTAVGTITLTVTGNYDTSGDSSISLTTAGQWVMFVSFYDGTNYKWMLLSHYNIGNIDLTAAGNLAGLTATAAEINRAAKNSTRPVAIGAASLTVTQALHDGKTILLDTATGVAVTLPAMTGSGARYRFVCSIATAGGSHVITATGAHLFGGILFNTDTGAGTLWTAVVAANPTGSTVITLDGSTKGGRKGDWFEIEDVATSIGMVRGMLNGSGTEATPFS